MLSAKSLWVWTGPTKENPAQRYKALRSHGVTGVFLGGLDDANVSAIRDAGMEAHIWMWTTNRGEAWIRENHPEWFMVSRSGKSCFDQPPYVDYYRWINPVLPEVRNYLADRVREIVSHGGVQGIHLDYVRYPDARLPRALWETYKLDQTEELPDYDFCYSDATREAFKKVSGRDPKELADPAHDQEWLHFRYNAVSSLVRELTQVAHEARKPISAAVFPTPRMARRICRQNWGEWPLDFACPMIYHSFYNEPVEWIGDCVLENLESVKFPIVAGLYMPAFSKPEEFAQALKLADRRGAAGVSLFGDIGEAHWKVVRESAFGAR
jgi:hypothetical protein